MSDIKTEDNDDFIVSSSDLEKDEADIAFEAKEKKKRKSKIISRIILVVSACVFIFAAYNLISILLEYKKGNDIYDNIGDTVLDDTPVNISIGDDAEITIPFKYDHQALLDINSDGLGFLYIPSLDTRLPIAQTTDNDFYLTHTFDKTYNSNGCVFEDYRITDKLNANHIILYGHSMNSGAMFGTLHKYKSSYFYNYDGNDVFNIYTEDIIKEYKIFTAYVSEPISDTYTFNFISLDGLRSYANRMKALSLYDTGVNVDKATQVVTLSTCTNNGKQRFIISGMYVGETTIEDFEKSSEGTTSANN